MACLQSIELQYMLGAGGVGHIQGCVGVLVTAASYSPVMCVHVCGGWLGGGALEVLLKAKVKSLTDGADHVLGQTLRTLQDVAGWKKSEQQVLLTDLF